MRRGRGGEGRGGERGEERERERGREREEVGAGGDSAHFQANR